MSQTQILLIIEFSVLVVLVGAWFARRRDAARWADLNTVDGDGQRMGSAVQPVSARRPVSRDTVISVRRQARHVPIPWGWPQCERYRPRRRSWFARLFRRRRVAEPTLYDPHVANCFRALLEDRYHHVDLDALPVVAYEPVSAEGFRAPLRKPDQLDDFGRQQSMLDGRSLPQVGAVASIRPAEAPPRKTVSQPPPHVVNIRRPWGW